MHIYILVHKGSGSSRGTKVLGKLLDACSKKNIVTSVFVTEYKGHAISLVQKIDRRIENDPEKRLVVIGGDGTLHEAINGLQSISSQTPIAYLSAGTGNDFNRAVKIQTEPESFLDSLINIKESGQLEIIKYTSLKDGSINYAVNSLGFGFDSLIVHLSSTKSSKALLSRIGLSKLSYLHHVVEAFKLHSKFSMTVIENGKAHNFDKVILASVTNHPYLGSGIKLDPLSSQNNHEIGLVITHHINLPVFLRLLTKLIKNASHLECTDNVKRLGSDKFEIILRDPQYMQVDGEDKEKDCYHIECELTRQAFWFTY